MDTQSEEEKFIKGFNDGFILAENQPELLKKILSNKENSALPYFDGLSKGQKQFEIDKLLEQAQSVRNKLKEKKKGIGR